LNSPPRKNIADIAETAAIVVRSRAAVTAGVALDLSFLSIKTDPTPRMRRKSEIEWLSHCRALLCQHSAYTLPQLLPTDNIVRNYDTFSALLDADMRSQPTLQ